MPINVPTMLPAIEELKKENIFIMEESRALHQDIRPLRVALLNLMPVKMVTETDLLRSLANTPLQVELDLLYMDEHLSKNTPREHMEVFYKTFDQIRNQKYDGLIITGAPVELIEFEEVDIFQDQKAKEEMIKKTGKMEVPIIEIDNEIVVGFDKEKICELLNIKD